MAMRKLEGGEVLTCGQVGADSVVQPSIADRYKAEARGGPRQVWYGQAGRRGPRCRGHRTSYEQRTRDHRRPVSHDRRAYPRAHCGASEFRRCPCGYRFPAVSRPSAHRRPAAAATRRRPAAVRPVRRGHQRAASHPRRTLPERRPRRVRTPPSVPCNSPPAQPSAAPPCGATSPSAWPGPPPSPSRACSSSASRPAAVGTP